MLIVGPHWPNPFAAILPCQNHQPGPPTQATPVRPEGDGCLAVRWMGRLSERLIELEPDGQLALQWGEPD